MTPWMTCEPALCQGLLQPSGRVSLPPPSARRQHQRLALLSPGTQPVAAARRSGIAGRSSPPDSAASRVRRTPQSLERDRPGVLSQSASFAGLVKATGKGYVPVQRACASPREYRHTRQFRFTATTVIGEVERCPSGFPGYDRAIGDGRSSRGTFCRRSRATRDPPRCGIGRNIDRIDARGQPDQLTPAHAVRDRHRGHVGQRRRQSYPWSPSPLPKKSVVSVAAPKVPCT